MYFVMFLTVASRLFPVQGQKTIVPHVCITEAGGTYFPLYSWLTNTTELQRRSPSFATAQKRVSICWGMTMIPTSIGCFRCSFCGFVRRRLLTHALSLPSLLCAADGWEITSALTITSKHENFWKYAVQVRLYRTIIIWFKKIWCFVSILYNCQ